MAKEPHDAKKLASLIRRLRSDYKPEPPAERDPVLQLVAAFMHWEAGLTLGETALGKLMHASVDVNELRVTLEAELVDVIGENYPLAHERIARMHEALNEVYRREYDVRMNSIITATKKEQRTYLDTLPGVPPYVAAEVMLVAFGGHAMPIDRKLVTLLASEGVVRSGADPASVESWMQRQVKVDDDVSVWTRLAAWANDYELPEHVANDTEPPDEATAPKLRAAARRKKTSKKKAGATAKKKIARRTTQRARTTRKKSATTKKK
ncbi:MAG: hypothetical protein WD009_05990 [Phycisphaeraceae bacterium]